MGWTINVATAPLGTPRANAFRVAIMARFPGQLVSWGTYSCRKQTLGSNWSGHAWGNADDIHPVSVAVGDRAVAWANANAKRFGIAYILWRGAAGHFPGHFHVEFEPVLSSGGRIPPCKGGPSVTITAGTVDLMAAKGRAPNAADARAGGRPGSPNYQPPSGGLPGGDLIRRALCDTVGLGSQYLPWSPLRAYCSGPQGRNGQQGMGLGELILDVLKIGAGAVVMFAGLAVIVMAATGQAPVPAVGKAVQAVGPARRASQRASAARTEARTQERRITTDEGRARVQTVQEGGKTVVKKTSLRDARRAQSEADEQIPVRRAERRRRGLDQLRKRERPSRRKVGV